MARIGVLGIGNVLMGDDALGAHVLKRLEAGWRFPAGVALVEAGTPGAALTTHLEGLDAVVVVDTVKLSGQPGEIRVLDKPALLARKPLLPMSPHEPGLREALFAMEFEGTAPPEVRLVGVVPARVELGVGLSAPVKAAVAPAVAEVLRQLASLGVEPAPREPALEPDLWWEASAGGAA
ncbi:MAG: hydrogenase maturation protease [Deltaproteobacteria bacterium]|nr:hydrogenase maturation protease [Deltaproteobacteria bacterium]